MLDAHNYKKSNKISMLKLNTGLVTDLSIPCRNIGNKILIPNFEEICTSINRPEEHLAKFISLELSVSLLVDSKGRLIVFYKNLKRMNINSLMKSYIRDFVMCFNCGKIIST